MGGACRKACENGCSNNSKSQLELDTKNLKEEGKEYAVNSQTTKLESIDSYITVHSFTINTKKEAGQRNRRIDNLVVESKIHLQINNSNDHGNNNSSPEDDILKNDKHRVKLEELESYNSIYTDSEYSELERELMRKREEEEAQRRKSSVMNSPAIPVGAAPPTFGDRVAPAMLSPRSPAHNHNHNIPASTHDPKSLHFHDCDQDDHHHEMSTHKRGEKKRDVKGKGKGDKGTRLGQGGEEEVKEKADGGNSKISAPHPINFGNFKREQKSVPIYEKYEIVKSLGKGTFGEVKKVRDIYTNEPRALKTIHRAFTEEKGVDPSAEFEVLMTLDHPNILRLYEFFVDQTNYYLITELCTGGDLLGLVKDKKLTESTVAIYMHQILSAIAYCHDRNIIHRDIKPENILISTKQENSPIKIIDFGCSKVVTSDELITKKIGTPYYIAPEVVKAQYNIKSDVWSCGVILYLLLVGYPPYRGKKLQDILKRIVKGNLRFPKKDWSNISDSAKNLIQKMLTYDPEERITAREALNDKWIVRKTSQIHNLRTDKVLNSFTRMREFCSGAYLQKTVLVYIAIHFQSEKEEKELKEVFQAFDINGDGELSKDELIAGYTQIYHDVTKAETEVNKILKEVDINQNGVVDYSEFLMANMNFRKKVNDRTLKDAFRAFDLDRDGLITLNDLKVVLGEADTIENDTFWEKLIEEVDLDGNGQIDLEEFKTMMHQLAKAETPPKTKFKAKLDKKQMHKYC